MKSLKRARSSLDWASPPEEDVVVVVSKSEKPYQKASSSEVESTVIERPVSMSEKNWGPEKQAAGALSSSSSDCWASLPEEILNLILNRIIGLSDYLRFAAVCKPWFSAAAHQKDLRRRRRTKLDVPFLLIPIPNQNPEAVEAASDSHRILYSVTQNKFLSREGRVPVPYPRRCCGSSQGWLGTLDPLNLKIIMKNPFTGKSFRLPSVNSDYYSVNPAMVHMTNYELKVDKVVLSCDPYCMRSPDDFVVVAIYGWARSFAYFKPGFPCWRQPRLGGVHGFMDVIYHLGKFYAVDGYYRVVCFDIVVPKNILPRAKLLAPRSTPTPSDKLYLVKSSSGADLLLVERFHKKRVGCLPACGFTWCFKVFKLLRSGGSGGVTEKVEKVEITSLGDDALFLGDNDSLSVSASNFPGCFPNCIYYTHDCVEDPCYRQLEPGSPRDTGIYFLETGLSIPLPHTFQTEMDMEDTTKQKCGPMPPAIWILPTMV